MKILKYKKEVYMDALALTHGWKTKIEEICVPELGLIVNKDHVFILTKEEMKKRVKARKTTEVSREDEEKFRKLYNYVILRDQAQKKIDDVHNQVKTEFFTAEVF